jgi:AcrR family transcriptional regulator
MKTISARNRVMTTAEELFKLHDFSNVSIRNISENAQVNISMIYYYFGSKEGLLENIMGRAECILDVQLEPNNFGSPSQLIFLL